MAFNIMTPDKDCNLIPSVGLLGASKMFKIAILVAILERGVELSEATPRCVCICTKRVCVRNTEPKACTKGIYTIQYIRIAVFVQSRRVHLFIVNCLLKNKFNIHVKYIIYTFKSTYKPNFHAKNII